MTLQLEFCGETVHLPEDRPFVLGRDADYIVDDNPYLHRQFLEIRKQGDLWLLTNIGSQLSATLSDDESRVHAWLAPGSALPVVFAKTIVRFTAGPTVYEISLVQPEAPFAVSPADRPVDGTTTLGRAILTPEQRLLVIALAEPQLQRTGTGPSAVPTSAEAATRLGWSVTKFNRKLDNVCQKLERSGVRGLHGDPGRLATTRKARLVEYALAVRLVAREDLTLLDHLTA